MKALSWWAAVLALLATAVIATPAAAQTTGEITGTVDANVEVDPVEVGGSSGSTSGDVTLGGSGSAVDGSVSSGDTSADADVGCIDADAG
ncbi:MAG: hypothetical protein KY396_06720, partial [Actinobacteria bacterium]|nr:hypothetical protein [Actinomycetota bacterium]